ncbi:MAG: uracil-DNA glycosylase, partial [Gemmataceae bacterium]|nr:uracil-DNA glycosylase [Gemmataceae bacterium]
CPGSAGASWVSPTGRVCAVGIRPFSAFTEEEEYVLAPGTLLRVADVQAAKDGLFTIRMEEQEGERMVT